MRDLEHFFGRGYIVAIVYSPNERYVLVYVIAPILRVYASHRVLPAPPVAGVTIFAFGNSATVCCRDKLTQV